MTTETTQKSFWSSPKTIFGTTNAMEIGKLYLVLSFVNALIAGLFAILMRLELWTPQGDLFQRASNYNELFTLHGTVMFFLVVTPLGAAFGNYVVPRLVAADNDDMYWPKWNNFAFWLLPIASLLIWFSQAPLGWTGYVPLSANTYGADAWIVGLVLVGVSSTIGSLNFILTIWLGRAPYVKWSKLDLFVWSILFYSILLLLATPTLVIALVMVLADRNFGTAFFAKSIGNPVMYQHLFWFFSHPEVYILVLPAFGLVSHIIAKFARRKIFGYTSMVVAMAAIMVLSFSVWAHHMYVTGINPFVRIYFTTMTFVIAIPSGIKVFNWLTTLHAGKIKYEVPMLFSLSFIIMFTLGGITGVYVNIIPLDLVLHDTYWVVSHFHFVVAAGSLQAFFAATYYYWPELTGRKYHDLTAKIHFWLWNLGNLVTFTAFSFLGFQGMPRRYWSYPAEFQGWHQVATVGAFIMGIAFLSFLVSMFVGWRSGEEMSSDNIFDLDEGYDFPKPFADYIKEEEGEELHVDHSLSWRAPVGALTVSLPLIAVLAFIGQGPFARIIDGTPIADPKPQMGFLLVIVFIILLGTLFYFESKDHVEDHGTVIDKYREKRHWEIWLFLSSEVVFFGTLIGSGIAMRLNNPGVWPDATEVLDVPVTAVNTFILICSSFTMAKAVESIQNGDQEKLKRFLLYTLLLGILFLSIQGFEYISLFAENEVALTGNAKYPLYSSAFFIQTGFHGMHVLVGILLLGFVLLRAWQGGYTKDNNQYVEYMALYWHFVDLVWIILFTVVYLM